MFLEHYLSNQLVIVAITLSITWFFYCFLKPNRSLPPGPWGLPISGYYPFLSSEPYLDFNRLSKRYGNVFSFRTVGGKLFVVLNGVKTIKDVLVNRSEEFIGRPVVSNLLEWISDGLGVTQEEGASWKEHRRFFIHSAKNYGFGKLKSEVLLHDEMKALIDDLRKTEGQLVDINFHIGYAVNSVVSQILYSKKFDKNSSLFRDISEGVFHLIEMFGDNRFMLVGPFFQYVVLNFFPNASKQNKGRLVLKKTIENIIDEHVATFDPNNLRDYMDEYLSQRRNLQKSGKLESSTYTMERLKGISMNMMMEGTESVTATICALLCELAKYPEAQIEAQRELDAVVGKERMPSWTDRQKLPFLDAMVTELLRVAQSFYITTHYSNFEETTILGYRIPRRSIIVGNLWSINNDETIYPNPKKFDPRRYLGNDGKKIKHEGPYPFGIGKRSCAGEALAQMEVFLVIACFVQAFKLLPGDKSGRTIIVAPRE